MKERFYLVRQHADWLARFARHSGSMAGYTGVESRSRSQVLSGVLGLIARFSF